MDVVVLDGQNPGRSSSDAQESINMDIEKHNKRPVLIRRGSLQQLYSMAA